MWRASLNVFKRERGIKTKDLLEFVHVVNLRSHRNVGDSLDNELDHDRHLVFLHQLPGGGECLLEFVRALDANRLAAEPLGNGDVIDPVAARLVTVDVLEGKAYLEIHFESALGLADQSEIGVIHYNVQVGQLVLRTDCQLLN